MVEKLIQIRDSIRSVNDEVRKLKHENYTMLHQNGDLKYFEEIMRTLCISAVTVATYVDQLEFRKEHDNDQEHE